MKMRFLITRGAYLIAFILFVSCNASKRYSVFITEDAHDLEILAAKEIRKYIYLTTGELPELETMQTKEVRNKKAILVGTVFNEKEMDFEEEELMIAPEGENLIITGGSAKAVLYAAYRFAEELGVRFYLHGDVIPDKKKPLRFPGKTIREKPVFAIRGILPFHDFPEGPDWWNVQDYKAYLAQLPKMRMNFIGFHTYPEHPDGGQTGYKAEPLVWIGREENIRENGDVTFGYPSKHFYTRDPGWGYLPTKTSDFFCGADQLFEEDYYGAEYLMGKSAWPHSLEENIQIFNDVGDLLDDAFSFAHDLGIKTCIGTETNLKIPSKLEKSLQNEGKKVDDSKVIKDMYKGIFSRIQKKHPLNYYWFWTPERWTWHGNSEAEANLVLNDMLLANEAKNKLGFDNLTLATCGWVLGPEHDRPAYDKALPGNMPFSCINRMTGFSPVDSSFNLISGRPKWAIPWIEDDPAQITPQLWVGRMRKDAFDAKRYGCDGLIGIHWRTKILSPNVSSLAKAAWNMDGWSEIKNPEEHRDMPVDDFYEDWCVSQFGSTVGKDMATIYIAMDGGGPLELSDQHAAREANLYRASSWVHGPGGIFNYDHETPGEHRHPNTQVWDSVKHRFDFIEDIEELADKVEGVGNKERFDYWLNTFLFSCETAKLGCKVYEMDSIVRSIDKVNPQNDLIQRALELRISLAGIYENMMTYHLQTVSTPGGLGTVANLEQHNYRMLKLLTHHDSLLTVLSGQPLPAEAFLTKKYLGKNRLFIPARPGILLKGDILRLKIITLSNREVGNVEMHYRKLGEENYKHIPANHINRGVWEVKMEPSQIDGDFEYYIVAEFDGEKIFYPATARDINETIVVW